MLLALLEAHPNALATWVFNSPEHGIMNQWDVCMRLRRRGVRIETVYSHHVNRYKRPVRIAAYRVVDKLVAAEIEGKMRKEAKNG